MAEFGTFLVLDFKHKLAWEFRPSYAWFRRHDPGHAVSIGFVYGEDITPAQLRWFVLRRRAWKVDYMEVTKPKPW